MMGESISQKWKKNIWNVLKVFNWKKKKLKREKKYFKKNKSHVHSFSWLSTFPLVIGCLLKRLKF